MEAHRADNVAPHHADIAPIEAVLPANWRDGRPQRQGYAIDDISTKLYGDAISLTQENGLNTLHVSVADIVATLGFEQLATITGKEKLPRTKLRQIVSDISLERKQQRPVLTVSMPLNGNSFGALPVVARECITTETLSFGQAEAAIERDNSAHPEIKELHRAVVLGLGKHSYIPRRSNTYRPEFQNADRLVRYSMLMATAAVARFMVERDIPGLFNVMPPGKKGTFYSADPNNHNPNAGLLFARLTSPGRWSADAINSANIVASLEGKPPLYAHQALTGIAKHFNALDPEVKAQHRNTRVRLSHLKEVPVTRDVKPTVLPDSPVSDLDTLQLSHGLAKPTYTVAKAPNGTDIICSIFVPRHDGQEPLLIEETITNPRTGRQIVAQKALEQLKQQGRSA